VRAAEADVEKGDIASAAAGVDAALAAHPESVALLALAARIAVATGEAERAIQHLQRAIPLAPDRLATYAELAKLHRRLGRLDASDAAFGEILARDPARASALRGLEENAAQRRREEERHRARRAAHGRLGADAATPAVQPRPPVSSVPQQTPAAELERQAVRARETGDLEGAVSLLRRAAKALPARLPLWRDLARDLRALGRLDEADEALRHILSIDPSRLSVHTALADNARRRGDAPAAAAHLGAAVSHHPGDATLRQRLIAALRQAGDPAAHAAAVDAMARDFPDDAEAQVAAAAAARAGGRREVEAACLERALGLAPAGSVAVALARGLSRAGRTGDAVALLVRACDAEPGPEALQELGALHEAAGDTEAACTAYERAIEADPGRVAAWIALAGIAARTVSASRARQVLRQARAAAGDHVALDFAEFDLLRHIGLDAAAEGLLAAARERAPTDARLPGRQAALDLDHGRFDAVEAAVMAMETQTVRQKVAAAMAAGRLEETRWRLPEALEAFNRALALEPTYAPAHSAAARALVGLLRPLEARRHLAEAKQLSREDQLARGRSLNPSQSLVGQLMSECWSNQTAMQLGCAAIAADRLDAFLTLVREEPDYTPGAIAFLVFLRRKGLLDVRPPPDASLGIPRRVLQFWDTDTLATDVADLMASWREGNPDWEHVRHTDRSARAFLEGLPDPRLRRAYRAARKPAQKADLLRLALLFHEGGVYVDADDRCAAPLDPFVAGRSLVVAQEGRGSIGNNLIAAAPGHPLIGAALELAVTAILRGDADTIWLSTGPGLLTRALAAHLGGSETTRADLGRGLVVLERFALRRFCAPNCKVAYKTTTRHWAKEEFGQAV
jgi:tetratricopeptide (TPR) repeat protein